VTAAGLSIVEFHDGLAQQFYDINAQWIESMFVLENHDRHVLENPQSMIINPGGVILFVASPDHGIVGAGALMKWGDGEYELTKMGVVENARGLKAGEFLLEQLIERAQALAAKRLYLLTNKKCAAAVHLYEKLGFEHSDEIMREFGDRYARCDVAMNYRL
jgi:ribosomal protein S18 acetylase RimI-like enzyme